MTKPGDEQRRQIAVALRKLRVDAGLSTTQLAKRLGCSQSKVSKTELAYTRPSPEDVEDWARETGAPTALRNELVELAALATGAFTEWRRELAPGRRRAQQDIQRMEAAASVIRVFSMDVISGLAQTRPYVEAIFRLGRDIGPTAEPLDEVIDARIARQEVLRDESKHFYLLMSEMALRRRLISAADMRSQIDRLAGLSKRRNVEIGIIPFHAEERVHQYHAFGVIGDPGIDDESIVLAESVTRAIRIREVDEIRQYLEHFEALRSAALEGAELRRFLLTVIRELTG